MPTKYLHTRYTPDSFPQMKKGIYPSYETTVKLTMGEEGLSSNEVEVSVGICSPNDMFCRALGRADADSKTPIIMKKHEVFAYMDVFKRDFTDLHLKRKGTAQLSLFLPNTRRLAIALLKG
jgi:hypothetical protein